MNPMPDKTYTAEQVAHHASILANGGYPNAAAMLATFAATLRQAGAVADDERQWRELLAIRVAGPMLYTDDGELSDATAEPYIDFLRDSADTIARKLADRTRAALARPASSEPVRRDEWGQRMWSSEPASGEAVAFCRVEDVDDNDSHLAQLGVKRGDKLYTHPAEPVKVPEGMVLVPREPTQEMLDAPSPGSAGLKRRMWQLMLAAAPGADGEVG